MESVPGRFQNTPPTLFKVWPASSSASIVFSKVGAFGIFDDGGDVRVMFAQGGVEGRPKMLDLDRDRRAEVRKACPIG